MVGNDTNLTARDRCASELATIEKRIDRLYSHLESKEVELNDLEHNLHLHLQALTTISYTLKNRLANWDAWDTANGWGSWDGYGEPTEYKGLEDQDYWSV